VLGVGAANVIAAVATTVAAPSPSPRGSRLGPAAAFTSNGRANGRQPASATSLAGAGAQQGAAKRRELAGAVAPSEPEKEKTAANRSDPFAPFKKRQRFGVPAASGPATPQRSSEETAPAPVRAVTVAAALAAPAATSKLVPAGNSDFFIDLDPM